MVIGIIATIISVISAIGGVVIDTGKAILDTIVGFFQTAFSLLQTFIDTAPTPFKVAIFMFFLLTIGNVFSGFMLSTRYACDGNNVLYETENLGTAMGLILKTQFQSIDPGERNSFILENYQMKTSSPSPTTIKCVESQPKLYFYSVNILSYSLWLLLLVIIFGTPLIWGYYTKMGALK
jgi:hypothetical protein